MPNIQKPLNQSMRRGCRRVSGTVHAGHAAARARHAPQSGAGNAQPPQNPESVDAEGLPVRERHGACGASGGMRQARAAEQEVAARQRDRVAARAAAQPARHSLLQHPGAHKPGFRFWYGLCLHLKHSRHAMAPPTTLLVRNIDAAMSGN